MLRKRFGFRIEQRIGRQLALVLADLLLGSCPPFKSYLQCCLFAKWISIIPQKIRHIPTRIQKKRWRMNLNWSINLQVLKFRFTYDYYASEWQFLRPIQVTRGVVVELAAPFVEVLLQNLAVLARALEMCSPDVGIPTAEWVARIWAALALWDIVSVRAGAGDS